MVLASSRPSTACVGTPTWPSRHHQAPQHQRQLRQQPSPPSLQLPAQSQLQAGRQLAKSSAKRSRTGAYRVCYALVMCMCNHRDHCRPCFAARTPPHQLCAGRYAAVYEIQEPSLVSAAAAKRRRPLSAPLLRAYLLSTLTANPYPKQLTLSHAERRRAYLKYRDRQRLQKEEDRRTIEELHSRLSQLECERSDLERRVELLQKVPDERPCSVDHCALAAR